MNANLVLLKKDGAHKTFVLPNPVTVLGRRHDCDLRIPLPMVSRRHCQLTLNKDSAKLRDLDSRAGTFVNGKRIPSEQDVALKAGDYVAIGPLTFVCQIDGKPAKIVLPKRGDSKRDASRSGSQAAPPSAKAKPKPRKAPATVPDDDLGSKLDDELDGKLGDDLDAKLDDELSDLDVSDSFINLDELEADSEELKDA